MDGLVHGQSQLNEEVKTSTDFPTLTKKQDRLSGDADAYVTAAKAEAANLKGGDTDFAQLLENVAGQFGTLAISADMLRASEQLDD